jgi:hypothetical protein
MQKQGLLTAMGPAMENEEGDADESDFTEEDKKKNSPRKR